MKRNIEIKIKLSDYGKTLNRIKYFSNEMIDHGLLVQKDIFYNSDNGRLKIREVNGKHEIIWYKRDDQSGPKLSDYIKIPLHDYTNDFKYIFEMSNGIRGIVNNQRRLFKYGQTRIHLDYVDHLGYYLELEVELTDDQSIEQGENIANEVMTLLNLHDELKITGAYIDLLDEIM